MKPMSLVALSVMLPCPVRAALVEEGHHSDRLGTSLIQRRLHTGGVSHSNGSDKVHAVKLDTVISAAAYTNFNASIRTFGPGGCVSLTRVATGTCVLRTQCSNEDISSLEVAFVCTNPGSAMPRALHSYGKGEFLQEETYDSGVQCDTCDVMPEYAESSAESLVVAGTVPAVDASSANLAAKFGPGECISTYKSSAGTCMIQTSCAGQSLSGFDVGVTCVDDTGDYTQYSFGKDVFLTEETFNTRIPCSKCLGIGDQPQWSGKQRLALLPKTLLDDINLLKSEIRGLKGNTVGGTTQTLDVGMQSEVASLKKTVSVAKDTGASWWPWGASPKALPSAKALHATTPKAAALAKAAHATTLLRPRTPPVVIPLGDALVSDPTAPAASLSATAAKPAAPLQEVLQRAAMTALQT